MLISLFEALRASRASILEKPISTNRATCGKKVQSHQLRRQPQTNYRLGIFHKPALHEVQCRWAGKSSFGEQDGGSKKTLSHPGHKNVKEYLEIAHNKTKLPVKGHEINAHG